MPKINTKNKNKVYRSVSLMRNKKFYSKSSMQVESIFADDNILK